MRFHFPENRRNFFPADDAVLSHRPLIQLKHHLLELVPILKTELEPHEPFDQLQTFGFGIQAHDRVPSPGGRVPDHFIRH